MHVNFSSVDILSTFDKWHLFFFFLNLQDLILPVLHHHSETLTENIPYSRDQLLDLSILKNSFLAPLRKGSHVSRPNWDETTLRSCIKTMAATTNQGCVTVCICRASCGEDFHLHCVYSLSESRTQLMRRRRRGASLRQRKHLLILPFTQRVKGGVNETEWGGVSVISVCTVISPGASFSFMTRKSNTRSSQILQLGPVLFVVFPPPPETETLECKF